MIFVNTDMLVKTRPKKLKSGKIKDYAGWYAMFAIPLIGFFVFNLYPILWSIHKAFYFYDGSLTGMRFTGLENFRALFRDTSYWTAWLGTLKYVVLKIPFEMILAMSLALLLNKGLKGSGFFRSIYYLPNVISIAIIGVVFMNMFDFFGFINGVLTKIGIIAQPINWFEKEWSSWVVIILSSIWNTFGINVMYFLAALANVPADVYEAATIDGASKTTVFFKITLPLMGRVLQTIFLLSINGSMLVNDLILVTTNGAPGGKTYSIMAYVTSKFVPGFADAGVNIGYGAAAGTMMAIIMASVAFIYLKLSKKLGETY